MACDASCPVSHENWGVPEMISNKEHKREPIGGTDLKREQKKSWEQSQRVYEEM